MDVLALLEQAREAGLSVTVADGKLVMQGPKRLAALAKMIGCHKDEVIAAIQGDSVASPIEVFEVTSLALFNTTHPTPDSHLSIGGDGDTNSPIQGNDGVLSPPPHQNSTSVGAASLRCRRCGHPGYIDIPIHKGQSIRRDCASCGRLMDFPVWYGVADGVRV